MLPLIKKGMTISYKLGIKDYTGKVFQSNPTTVWIEDDKGRITRLHKKKNFIKIIDPPGDKGRKEENPKKKIDDLFNDLL